jgi:hypothetical protein
MKEILVFNGLLIRSRKCKKQRVRRFFSDIKWQVKTYLDANFFWCFFARVFGTFIKFLEASEKFTNVRCLLSQRAVQTLNKQWIK